MTSIYARLGFDSTNPIANSTVQDFSESVKNQMSLMPPFLNEWQTQDVANANTSGYYQNPLISILSSVYTTANNMVNEKHPITGSSNAISILLANTRHNAVTITYSNTQLLITSEYDSFLYHTNRLSNMVPLDTNTTLPHYQTAMGVGKMMIYITNKSDGIQNNSPIMGNFTSLYTGNTLTSLQANAATLLITLNNSITVTTTGTPPNTITTYSSNISLSNAQDLDDAFSGLLNTMRGARLSDTAFFQNSSAVLDDFNKVREFSKMGQTETQLVTENIGSPKIIERLNSEN
jgi:hypothetical protein